MAIRFLIEKEFKQMGRSVFLVALFILLPTFMILVSPRAANQEVKGLRFCFVDGDHSTMSQRLVNKIAASQYFTLVATAPSYAEALRHVEAGEADVVVEVKDGFEKSIVTTGRGGLMIAANAVNGIKGNLGSAYVNSIVGDFADELAAESGARASSAAMGGFSVEPMYRFNPALDYKAFMVPAMMVLMLTLLTGFLPALNIVGEKEKGTIEQMNVTPVGRFPFVLSKLIPYWVVGFAVVSYAMVLARLAYGLVPAGSLLTIYTFVTVYILVISSIGLIISNYSSTMQQALFLMFFFLVIFILMSGMLTPVSSMPQWAQTVTVFNPLRYFIEVMRAVYLKGSSITELLPQLLSLCAYGTVTCCWAIWSYRKNS